MKILTNREYGKFLSEIKARIITARIQAVRSVNKELIKLYWDIGKTIVKRQEQYKRGDAVVEKLAQLVREIPWGQNIVIMQMVKDAKEREYYIRATAEIGWSRNVLLNYGDTYN